MRLLILLFGIFFSKIVLGQIEPKTNVLIPPSPNASSFGKFGIVPVNNFTGVPSINYPIYKIDQGDISLPIEIKYHSGGITVKEEASEVGLGWALSAGGTITSSVRGNPDFPAGFTGGHQSIPDDPQKNLSIKSPMISYQDQYYLWSSESTVHGGSGSDPNFYSGLTLSHKGVAKDYFYYFKTGVRGEAPDFASDLYMINIGDRHYKFIFDNNFKPVVLGDGALKIEIIENGNFPDWKVTDEKGIVYFFTQRQISYSNTLDPYYTSNRTTPSSVSAWYLTKIVSPISGEIILEYNRPVNSFTRPAPIFSERYIFGNISPNTQQVRDEVTTVYTIYEELNISKISFALGTVNFSYAADRTDLQNSKRLTSIIVNNKFGEIIKTVNFDNNGYFYSGIIESGNSAFHSAFNSLGGFTRNNLNMRLKLNGIVETDKFGLNEQKTYYLYEENVNLPSKVSLLIDHWGFYKGRGSSSLIPTQTVLLQGQWQTVEGTNRDADPSTMQANILKSIIYPTGGVVKFNYESHQKYATEITRHYRDTMSSPYKAPGEMTLRGSGFVGGNGNININSEWSGKRLHLFCFADPKGADPGTGQLELVVYQNGSVIKRLPIETTSRRPVVDSSIVVTSGSTYRLAFEAYLPSYFKNCEIRTTVSFTKISSYTDTLTVPKYFGGLRVSKIETSDPKSGISSFRKFKYEQPSENGSPIYLSPEGEDVYTRPGGGTDLVQFTNVFRYLYGHSIYPFSEVQESAYFGYGKVQIVDSIAGKINGMSEYYYSTSTDLNVNGALYYSSALSEFRVADPVIARVPPIVGSRGDLWKEYHYVNNDGIFKPISGVYYYFNRDEAPKIWQMVFNHGLGGIRNRYGARDFNILAHQFAIPVYKNILKGKENYDFDEYGRETLKSFEAYTYDRVKGHFQLIKKTIGTSSSDTISTYFSYPQDFPDLTGTILTDQTLKGIKKLQQMHVFYPIETYGLKNFRDSVNTKFLGSTFNIYNSEIPLLAKQEKIERVSKSSFQFEAAKISNGSINKEGAYEQRFELKYNSQKKIIEIIEDSGKTTTVIWGYSDQYPVLEIKNATYDEVLEALTQPIIDNLNLTAHSEATMETLIKSASDKLRTNLPQAMVTSYTYKPLVGMTSKTDARGVTEYYKYDGMQRLQAILDHLNNVNRSFDYHYRSN